jgi:ribosomal protein S18 acetylase RimI-like enzyme
MSNTEIRVRQATIDDVPLVGLTVLLALHYDESHPMHTVFVELAGYEKSQYSYRNALVAEYNGEPAGVIIGYDGGRLQELRKPLYDIMMREFGQIRKIEDETSAGEFYIDSFAVLPQYRGCGVGHSLLSAARDKAFASGYERVGLLVDFTNPRAEKLYASLGFERVNATTFLGCDMWHMQARRHS